VKPSQLASLLEKVLPARHPILVKGKPGVGKTSIAEQVCAKLKYELMIEHPVVSDPTDYKGLPFAVKGEANFLPFANLKRMMTATRPLVVLLDDVGQAPPLVQASLMQLLLSRSINGKSVSEYVSFMACTNRRADKAGVSGMLEPVKSRFCTIVELDADIDDWVKWALNADMPMELIAFLRYRPNLLCDFKPTAELTNSPSPRTAHNIGKLMRIGLPPELEYETFSGAAGEGFASELIGFLKIWRNLPSPDMVIMAPDKVEVPKDIATLYAICGALAAKAGQNSFANIMKYGNRMPPEFSVLLTRDCCAKEPSLVNTKAFVRWAEEHKDFVI
jgi:hypothetical protein